jgi:hypothetical protein
MIDASLPNLSAEPWDTFYDSLQERNIAVSLSACRTLPARFCKSAAVMENHEQATLPSCGTYA